jgi:uncharacterized protein (TIGR00255 family)
MALRSMTGFGRASASLEGVEVVVEVRSVNHRGLDAKVGLPSTLLALESKVLSVVRETMSRGRVDLKVHFTDVHGTVRPLPVFSPSATKAVIERLEALREEAGIEEPIVLSDLLSFREALTKDPRGSLGPAIWPELEGLIRAAIAANVAERDREGGALSADMVSRLEAIGGHFTAIAAVWPTLRDCEVERLRTRVSDAVERFGVGEVSEERIVHEVILAVERSDIAEELTRAAAHVERLLEIIGGHDPVVDGRIGKKLDFYFQELMREANTTGSKSHSELIASHVVDIRSEIERLREQVLNVE